MLRGLAGRWLPPCGYVAMLGMALLIGWIGIPAHACYTGLVNIPTAEVIGDGQCGVELQFDDTFGRGSSETHIVNTELGLGPRLEAGVDFDLSRDAETRLLLNAKYLLVTGDEKHPSLAVGICNLGRHYSAVPYLATLQPLPGSQLHLGLTRIEDHGRWFIGLTHEVNDWLTLMGDYTSGSENLATLGFNYQSTNRFGVMAGITLPNSSEEDTGFTIHFVWIGPFRHTEKGQ